ncbi:MAG: hypothetical protein AABX23_02220 [Nanoarchaeota archaeon]
MKRLFIFTYPKLTLYVIAIILAYFVFQMSVVSGFIASMNNLFYLSIFLAGLLFSAGFTTPIATGFLLASDPSNIYLAAGIGAIGALIADLGIFSFMRLSFNDEFKQLKHTSFIRHIATGVRMIVPKKFRSFFVYVLVILIIASPLPDELAVAMLAGFTKIHHYGFMLMSYIGNAIGIFILLSI